MIKNILIISNNYFPIFENNFFYSGVEKIIDNQIKILNNCGEYNIKIVATKDSIGDNLYRLDDYSKYYYKSNNILHRNSTDKIINFIKKCINRQNTDIILSHIENSGVNRKLSDLSKELDIPVIMYNHNIPYMGLISKNINESYKYAVDNGCLTVSPSKYTRDMNNAIVDNCIIYNTYYNLIDTEVEVNFNNRNNHVISLSRIASDMRQNILSLAFKLSNRYCDMYGNLNSDEEDYYNNYIKVNLNDKVNYHGSINHSMLMEIINNSSLMVHSVIDDAAPNVLVESLEYGTPAILLTGKNKCGSHELVEDMKINMSDLYCNIYRLKWNNAANKLAEYINNFFDSPYNTIEFRQFITKTCREFFNYENSGKRLIDTIDKSIEIHNNYMNYKNSN